MAFSVNKDPNNTAQNAIRCYVCDRGPVKLYCSLCAANLCTGCSCDHVLSDPLRHHQVVAFINRKAVSSTSESHTHGGCPCPECKANARANDEMDNISDTLKHKLSLLRKEAAQIKSQKIPEIARLMKEMEDQIADIQATYKQKNADIISQGRNLHAVIDCLVQEYKTDLETMRRRDLKKFQNQQEKFESLITEAKYELKAHESTDISQMDTFRFSSLPYPDPLEWTPPNFVPIKVTKKDLKTLFGTLNESSVVSYLETARPATVHTKNPDSGFRLQRYRPEKLKCMCETPKVMRSLVGGASKCSRCKKFVN